MNLTNLFEVQRELDAKILLQKGLVGQDLLDKKILSLQVELGELANEWRGFKFWSKDQRPRTEHECEVCEGEGTITLLEESTNDGEGRRLTYIECRYCNGDGYLDRNPLLEEYVDCLHFILSIGLESDFQDINLYRMNVSKDGVTEFNLLMANVSGMWLSSTTESGRKHRLKEDYQKVFSIFFSLGEMLGFTWEQVEAAYLEKNKINHERQVNGY